MADSKSPASWKQARSIKKESTRRSPIYLQRTLFTIAFLLIAAAITGLIVWKFRQRPQVTSIVLLGDSEGTESRFTLPPIRFLDKGWSDLTTKLEAVPPGRGHIRLQNEVDQLGSGTVGSKIAQAIGKLRDEDALIVWINGRGVCFGDKPVIVGPEFELPENSKDLSGMAKTGKLIELESVLAELANWSGPKLLILDWGQELFDPRIDCMGNNFLGSLEKLLKAAPAENRSAKSSTWVLVSHFPQEISLVDSVSQQSVFARAVTDALIGERRLPSERVAAEYRSELPLGKRSLSVANLMEYVYRRVSADTAGYQTCWLLKSGKGLVTSEETEWKLAEATPLVQLDPRDGLPIGFTKSEIAGRSGETVDPKAADPKVAEAEALKKPQFVPKAATELTQVWQLLDSWRSAKPELNGWSEAALAPLAYKSLSTEALFLDLAAYSGADNLSEVADFRERLSKIERPQNLPFLKPLEPDTDPAAVTSYRNSLAILRDRATADVVRRDLICLVRELGCLKSLEFDELSAVATSIEREDSLPSAESINENISHAIDLLVNKLADPTTGGGRGELGAVLEVLLRSPLLSAKQRSELRSRQSLLWVTPVGDETWPAKAIGNGLSVKEVAPVLLPSIRNADLLRENVTQRLLDESGRRKTAAENEAAFEWTADGRDVFVRLNRARLRDSVSAGEWFPDFPARPQPASAWIAQWDGIATEQGPLRLDGKQRLKLQLKRIGADELAFPKLWLNLSNLRASVAGNVLTGEKVELREDWFNLSERTRTLAIDLEAIDPNQSNAVLSLESRDLKGAPPGVEFDLPLTEPIELLVEEKQNRGGMIVWNPVQTSRRTLLPLFVGRETKFRFRLSNRDELPHTVTAKLIAIPRDQVAGSIGNANRPDLAASREPQLAWNGKLAAKTDLVVPLAAPVVAPPVVPPATPPAGTAPVPAANPPTSIDAAGGFVIELEVDGRKQSTYLCSLIRRPIEDYVVNRVRYEAGQNALLIESNWKDDSPRDGKADLAPVGLSKETPVVIEWDPFPWRVKARNQINVESTKNVLEDVEAKPKLLVAKGVEFPQELMEVWLSVDGAPRSEVFELRSFQEDWISLPQRGLSRLHWRSFRSDGLEPPIIYLPFQPPKNDETVKDAIALESTGAEKVVFPDLKKGVKLQLAIDFPERSQRFGVLLSSEVVAGERFDRDYNIALAMTGEELGITWREEDVQVTFDFSQKNIFSDLEFGVTVDPQNSEEMRLPTIGVDCNGPELVASKISQPQVAAGSADPIQVTLRTTDLSGKITAKIDATKVGGAVALPVQTKTISSGKSEVIDVDVSKLEIGVHELAVVLEDPYKHQSRKVIGKLRVNAADGDSMGIVGDLNVKAFRPGKGAIRNDVQFKIEPDAEGQTPKGRDEVVFQKVKKGKYKISATFSESSTIYKGEKEIEIRKLEDFQKVWELDLKKSE